MKVIHIPALSDNYMYLLVDEKTNQCAAVDPAEPQKLIQSVRDGGFQLTSILTTHHHWDHAGCKAFQSFITHGHRARTSFGRGAGGAFAP